MQVFATIFRSFQPILSEDNEGKRLLEVMPNYQIKKETLNKVLGQLGGEYATELRRSCCEFFSTCDVAHANGDLISAPIKEQAAAIHRHVISLLVEKKREEPNVTTLSVPSILQGMSHQRAQEAMKACAFRFFDLGEYVHWLKPAERMVEEIAQGIFGEAMKTLLLSSDASIVEHSAFFRLLLWHMAQNGKLLAAVNLCEEERETLILQLRALSRDDVKKIYENELEGAAWPQNILMKRAIEELAMPREQYANFLSCLSVEYAPPSSMLLAGAIVLECEGMKEEALALLSNAPNFLLRQEYVREFISNVVAIFQKDGIVAACKEVVVSVELFEDTDIPQGILGGGAGDNTERLVMLVFIALLARVDTEHSLEELLECLNIIEDSFFVESECSLYAMKVVWRRAIHMGKEAVQRLINTEEVNYFAYDIERIFQECLGDILLSSPIDYEKIFSCIDGLGQKAPGVFSDLTLFNQDIPFSAIREILWNNPEEVIRLARQLVREKEYPRATSSLISALVCQKVLPERVSGEIKRELDTLDEEDDGLKDMLLDLDLDKEILPQSLHKNMTKLLPQHVLSKGLFDLYRRFGSFLIPELREHLFERELLDIVPKETQQELVELWTAAVCSIDCMKAELEDGRVSVFKAWKEKLEHFFHDDDLLRNRALGALWKLSFCYQGGENIRSTVALTETTGDGANFSDRVHQAMNLTFAMYGEELLTKTDEEVDEKTIKEALNCFTNITEARYAGDLYVCLLSIFLVMEDRLLAQEYSKSCQAHMERLLKETDPQGVYEGKLADHINDISYVFHLDTFFQIIPEEFQMRLFSRMMEGGGGPSQVSLIEHGWDMFDHRILDLLARYGKRDLYVIIGMDNLLRQGKLSDDEKIEKICALQLDTSLQDACFIVMTADPEIEEESCKRYLGEIRDVGMKEKLTDLYDRQRKNRSWESKRPGELMQFLIQKDFDAALCFAEEMGGILQQSWCCHSIMMALLQGNEVPENALLERFHALLRESGFLLKSDFILLLISLTEMIVDQQRGLSKQVFLSVVPEEFRRSVMKLLVQDAVLRFWVIRGFGFEVFEEEVSALFSNEMVCPVLIEAAAYLLEQGVSKDEILKKLGNGEKVSPVKEKYT